VSSQIVSAGKMTSTPKYISNDVAAINEFIDKFDVSHLYFGFDYVTDINLQVFLLDCDGKSIEQNTQHSG